jgi:Family of unknown function (DUF6600)
MRTLAVALAPLLLLPQLARAQQPFEDHLLSEEEYLAQPAPAPYPAPTPQPGDAQPYTGQPPAPEPYSPDPAADAEDDVAVDDEVYQLDDGWEEDAWTDFDTTLSPYGSWVDVPDYGRVWSPSSAVVGADFFPYATSGHWVLTEYGWTWVSDWDWGWAPFHYGRWVSVFGYGWCWRPGRLWGPSWVAWRHGGGYVGWSPLGPRGVRIAAPRPYPHAWRFSTAAELAAPHPHFLPSAAARTIVGRTTPVANLRSVDGGARARFNTGPHPGLIASAAGRAYVATPIHSFTGAAPRPSISLKRPPSAMAPIAPRPAGFRSPATLPAGPGAPAAAPHLAVAPHPAYGAVPSYRYAAPAWSGTARPAPTMAAPAWHGAPAYVAPRYTAAPSYARPAPVYAAPRYTAPAYAPRYTYTPHYTAPAYAPRYTAPSYTPHYTAPSYTPHYAAPAPHYSAPAYRPAPAPHYSAPSFHSAPHMSAPSFHSGGGFRRR